MFKYQQLKNIIFKFEPETAHNIVEFIAKNLDNYFPKLLSFLEEKYFVKDKSLSQEILGIKFLNPIGLAAGFDKNANFINSIKSVGFGFMEFGTVTPKPQIGNDKPRLFRFPKYKTIQNAMGFNNDGMNEIAKRVTKYYHFSIPIGANIGKNKTTSQNEAINDYEVLIKTFEKISDYLVINISSPNTPGLRDLQNEEFIKELFIKASFLTSRPIFLKIAPDLEIIEAINICKIAIDNGASGIIATNTTVDYSLLNEAKNFGGLSGEVLRDKSYNIFKELAREFFGKTILISVGGINNANEAYKRIKAGASLVQVYSALIFEGPNLVKNMNNGIIELLKKDGFNHISEAIGINLK